MGHRDGDTLGKRLAEGLPLHKLYLHAIFMVRNESPYNGRQFIKPRERAFCWNGTRGRA